MSRPRKPFGATHPGRLPATMIKVLAAEMSDPQRLRRGKQYARDGSVLDIAVEPGIVTCEVQGSRPTPYIASIEVTRGDGMPLRRDVVTRCTCPDDDNWDDHACKHTIAAMFAFSDELLLEPELLDLWRGRSDGPVDLDPHTETDTETDFDFDFDTDADSDRARRPAGAGPTSTHRHLRLVGADDTGTTSPGRRPPADPLLEQLRLPAGTSLPPIPDLEPADSLLPRRDDLAAVLRDAIAQTRVDWD